MYFFFYTFKNKIAFFIIFTQASTDLKIKYSTAKVILKIYKKFGRIGKKKIRNKIIIEEKPKNTFNVKEIVINEYNLSLDILENLPKTNIIS